MGIGFSDKIAASKIDSGAMARHDSVVYDDVRTHPTGLPDLGANAPTKVIIKNTGGGTAGDSLGLNGSTQYATLPDNIEIDAIDNASFSFWTKPTSNLGSIAFRDNYIYFRKDYSDLIFSIDGSSEKIVSGVLVNGANHHIGVSCARVGPKTEVIIRVNNIEVYSASIVGYVLSAQTTDFIFGYDGTGDMLAGSVDEYHMYNIVLTPAQFSELYNGGAGRVAVPSGVTEATDLVFRFHFDNPNETDNDSTLGAGHDLVFTGAPTNEDPLITIAGTVGSFGVVALSFPDGQISQIFSTAQLPHTYRIGGDIYPHVHWMNPSAGGGNVVWGLEYIWVSPFAQSPPETTIVSAALAAGAQGQHNVQDIATLDGTGKGISSMIVFRLYRDATDPLDTFVGPVLLSEFDFHVPINSLGSMEIYSKR